MEINSNLCAYVERTSIYLTDIVNKYIEKSKRNFVVIDIDNYTVYTPRGGFFECNTIDSLKELAVEMARKSKVDRIYIAKNLDEKWIADNIYLFTLDNSSIRKHVLINALGRILNIIPIKRRSLFNRKHISPETIIDVIDLYTKY